MPVAPLPKARHTTRHPTPSSSTRGPFCINSRRRPPPGQRTIAPSRKEIPALAQAREIDVILVTELTRWGRSMLDLFHSSGLASLVVSVVAQTGLQFRSGECLR